MRLVQRDRTRLVLALFALSFALPAHAFTIRGTVVNGTTGAKVDNAKIVVVNPSEGMMEEGEFEARGGRFEVPNLDPKAPMYMLRIDYDGVSYNNPVQPAGGDQDVTVTVYDATTSWDGINVSVPHLAASRQGDHLLIEELFEISNESAPAKTAAGDNGYFRIFIPTDVDSVLACFATSLGVPIDRTPIPTGDPGVYRVEYPIRPGLTRIGLAYKVPYASGRYSLKAPVLHDLGHVQVFAVDTDMKITSSSHELQSTEPVHGMTAFLIHGVAKGSTLALDFEGGSGNGMANVDGEVQGEVQVVPNQAHNIALLAMVPMLLVLLGLVGMTQRNPNPLDDPKVLRAHYDALVKRLARLDDLRAAEGISADAHRAARDEMTAKLSGLAMKMRSLEGSHAKSHGSHAHEAHARAHHGGTSS